MIQDLIDIPSLNSIYNSLRKTSLEDSIHRIGLFVLLGFILFNRVRNYADIRQANGRINFPSVDGWYHRRATVYTVENYPHTLNFDPYSGFDVGNQVGQFGTVFDWFLATIALIIGGGDPSAVTIDIVLAFVPPILATITGFVIYYLSTALTNRWGGLTAVSILALTPGLFLSHSIVGFIDHHIAETVLVSASLFSLTKFTAAARNHPIPSLRELRDPLNPLLAWPLLTGVINAIYLLVWPPGLLYIAILSVGFACAIILEYLKGRQATAISTGSGIAMLVTGLVVLPFLSTVSPSATTTSSIQVSLPISIGLGCFALGYSVRVASSTQLHKGVYLSSLLTISSIAIGALYLLVPSAVSFFLRHSSRVFWFLGGSTGVQIAEATTLSNPFEFGFVTYGFGLFTAIIGCIWMGRDAIVSRTQRSELVLLSAFTIIMSSATISQPRFDYYLVISIATCTSYTLYRIYTTINQKLTSRETSNPELQSKMVIGGVTLLVLAPLLFSGAPMLAANSYTEPSSHNGWEQSFNWIETETPPFGAYNVENSNRVGYTGPFDRQSQFDYEKGQYGILSRWAIGHRLTVETQRVPVSNPHQQHSTVAANILLAPSEEKALQILNSELDRGSGVQYIMLGKSWGSGTSRSFTAPTVSENAYGLSKADIGTPLQSRSGSHIRTLQTERSYQSLRTRLYQFHGSAAPASQYVVYTNTTDLSAQDRVERHEINISKYNSSTRAASVSKGDPNAIHGGTYGEPPAEINALQHFRLVHASEGTINRNPISIAGGYNKSNRTSAVKTFERVQGAQITGTAPKNATIKATVELKITTTGNVFEYTQYAETRDNGSFTLIVPYATTGYGQYTPSQGYTNTSIRAKGPYQVSTIENSSNNGSHQVVVPEGAVLGEEEFNTTVQLADS